MVWLLLSILYCFHCGELSLLLSETFHVEKEQTLLSSEFRVALELWQWYWIRLARARSSSPWSAPAKNWYLHQTFFRWERFQVLLKARPHFQEHFLIDLGTVTITNSYKQVPGKYRNYPAKLKWVSSYCLSLKNLYIITKDKFPLAPMTSAVINMHMTQMTDEEKKLTDLCKLI